MPDVEGSISVDISTALGLDALKDALRSEVMAASAEVAKYLLEDSRPFVPVLTGELIDSGKIVPDPSVLGALTRVRIIYGSEAVPYAQIQHEQEFNHPSLGFFGAAKFLETPLKLNAPFYMAVLSEELGRRLDLE